MAKDTEQRERELNAKRIGQPKFDPNGKKIVYDNPYDQAQRACANGEYEEEVTLP
ncbi:MAG TPA: hypothetical protein VKX49_12730 [Bryobacteraceae bacterium]|nr:hypothetical protein [Bryobacteraceae bacterium]